LSCLYHCPDCEPSDAENVLTVLICRLRAKIRSFGLKIISNWNGHYQLVGDLHVDWRGYHHLHRYVPCVGADKHYHWSARSLGTVARSIAGEEALREDGHRAVERTVGHGGRFGPSSRDASWVSGKEMGSLENEIAQAQRRVHEAHRKIARQR